MRLFRLLLPRFKTIFVLKPERGGLSQYAITRARWLGRYWTVADEPVPGSQMNTTPPWLQGV